jgi:hypothetical protein
MAILQDMLMSCVAGYATVQNHSLIEQDRTRETMIKRSWLIGMDQKQESIIYQGYMGPFKVPSVFHAETSPAYINYM